MNNEQIANKLKSILKLRYEPVGVKLMELGDEVPDSFKVPESSIRHCQTIMSAKDGKCFNVPSEKHACVVGASSLSIAETPEKVKSGEFHSNLGMFNNKDAAAKMIEQRYVIESGNFISTLVGPLRSFETEPDVVVLVDIPETLYWLIPAHTFFKGGRLEFNTAAFQATCVDSTIIPINKNKMNLSLGCFGCRRSTDIKNEEMLAGIPYKDIGNIVNALERMVDGPMKKARNK